MAPHAQDLRSNEGFTLVELLVVVLIIGILAAIAFPVFTNARQRATRRACFHNQRSLEGAVMQWLAIDPARTRADVAGVVTQGHPLIVSGDFRTPPRCPAGEDAVNPLAPTAAEGAYTLDAQGAVVSCGLSDPPHGHF